MFSQDATSIKEDHVLDKSFVEKDANVWNESDVSEFLLFNQCATYRGVFLSQVMCFLNFNNFFIFHKFN